MRMATILGAIGLAVTAVPAMAEIPVSPAPAIEDGSLIAASVAGAIGCAVATGAQGVDSAWFRDKPQWLPSPEGFKDSSGRVTIRIAKELIGSRQVCESITQFASQSDQDQVVRALEILLKKKLVDGESWIFTTQAGQRNMTIYPSRFSTQPRLRVVSSSLAGL